MEAATADAQDAHHDRARRHRSAKGAWPSIAAGGAAIGSLVWLAWQAGGYFPPDYLLVGAIAFAVAGVLLVLHVPRYRLSQEALIALGALAALAVWTGVSASWSPTPDAALEDMQRNVAYVGIFGLALLAAGSGRHSPHLVTAVLGAICIVSGAALVCRLYPDLIKETLPVGAPYRLSYPWTYWNGAGAFAAMGVVLAGGIAADPRSRIPLRALAAGASVALFVVMYLSFSRGAWIALIVGVVVLVAMGAHWGSLLLTVSIVGLAAAFAVLRLRSYPALTVDPSMGAGQESAGHAYAPQLLLLIAGAAMAQGLVAAGRTSETVMGSVRRLARPVGTGLGVLLVLFALVAYGLRAGSLEGWTAERLDSAVSWIDEQWDDFLNPVLDPGTGSARLATARGTRSEAYRIAFDAFEGSPLWGEGAGSFERRWYRDRDVFADTRNAHSLEIETLGELGIIGFAILLAFIASLVAAAVRSRIKPEAMGRSRVAAVSATVAVWIVHSAVDWAWQMTALTGMVLVLAATLYPQGRARRRIRTRPTVTAPR